MGSSFHEPSNISSEILGFSISSKAFSTEYLTPQVSFVNLAKSASECPIKMLSNNISFCIVHNSNPIPPIFSNVEGEGSLKKFGFAIRAGFQIPLYAGLSIMGGVHFPLYSGFFFIGLIHLPQPDASRHLGLGT